MQKNATEVRTIASFRDAEGEIKRIFIPEDGDFNDKRIPKKAIGYSIYKFENDQMEKVDGQIAYSMKNINSSNCQNDKLLKAAAVLNSTGIEYFYYGNNDNIFVSQADTDGITFVPDFERLVVQFDIDLESLKKQKRYN